MPGPKANPQTCFKRLFAETKRLANISTTKQQFTVCQNLLNGLRTIEPLWYTPETNSHLPTQRRFNPQGNNEE